jgi:hypothetical protein
MKSKTKTHTIGYTLQPLNKTFEPAHHENFFKFWAHVIKFNAQIVGKRIKDVVWSIINERNLANICEQNALEHINRLNRNKMQKVMYNQWSNPTEHQDTQIVIHKLKYGTL